MQALLPAPLRQGKTAARPTDCVWRLTAIGMASDAIVLKRAPKQLMLRQLLMQHPEGLDAATRGCPL